MRYIVVLIFTFFTVSSHTLTTSSVVILDVDKVITNAVAYQKFKNSWDKESIIYQKEIEAYESKMVELDKKIISSTGNTKSQDLNTLKKQLSDYEFTIQKLVDERKNILDSSFAQALSQIKGEISTLVSKYAKKNNLTLVLPKSQTIYSTDQVEITDIILSQLNENLKSVTIKNNSTDNHESRN